MRRNETTASNATRLASLASEQPAGWSVRRSFGGPASGWLAGRAVDRPPVRTKIILEYSNYLKKIVKAVADDPEQSILGVKIFFQQKIWA